MIQNHRKPIVATLGGAIVTLLATAAWAAFQFNVPFVGTWSGEDLRTAIRAADARPASGNDPLCTWTVNADGAVTLTAPKLPRAPMVTTCRGDLSMSNDGETTLYVGGFTVSTSPGATVESAIAATACGAQVTPGNTVGVVVRVLFSNVQPAATGTLTGQLAFTDTPGPCGAT